MALTRKFLNALGIEEAKIEQIIEAHTETVDALKEERDKYKADADKLPGVTKERDDYKTVADKADKDPYKVKYDALKEEYDNYKTDQQKREKTAKVNDAVRAVLKEIGVADKRIDAVMRVTDTGELELDENGKIVTEKELKKQLKDEWADFIVTRREQGANVANPPENNGGSKLTKAEIYAKDEHGRYKLSTAERQKAIAENPDYMKG